MVLRFVCDKPEEKIKFSHSIYIIRSLLFATYNFRSSTDWNWIAMENLANHSIPKNFQLQ